MNGTYVFEFDGFYLGGIAVVVALNKEAALAMVQTRVLAAGLDTRTIKLKTTAPRYADEVILFQDGDY